MGGSQGATKINNAIKENMEALNKGLSSDSSYVEKEI